MAHQDTNTRARSGQRREGERAALPAGTQDQSLLLKDLKQAALFVGGFVLLGILAALLFAQLQGAF